MKSLIAAFFLGLVSVSPVSAQDSTGFTTTDDTINAMMADWFVYDEACRGTNPSQGADGFCGAREYIGWALNQSDVCLAESEDLTQKFWQKCTAESVRFEDPLAGVRDQLGAQAPTN